MKPIKTATTGIVYRGPISEIGDLWCERVSRGEIRSFWKPSEDELAVLAGGGCIQLDVLTEPLPPLAVNVSPVEAVGEHSFKRDPRLDGATKAIREWMEGCGLEADEGYEDVAVKVLDEIDRTDLEPEPMGG